MDTLETEESLKDSIKTKDIQYQRRKEYEHTDCKIRNCLKCRKLFESKSSGNRICQICNSVNDDIRAVFIVGVKGVSESNL